MTDKLPALLEKSIKEIARAAPKHLNADRMARIALTTFRMNPKLADCDPVSVLACIMQAAAIGLEIGVNGECYLVPFKSECQLILGYQGLMKLARQSGQVVDIYPVEVRENDEFDMELGLSRHLVHKPLKDRGFVASDEKRGPVVGFYAVAVMKDGSKTFQALSAAEVEKIRDRSRGYQASKRFNRESAWDTDFVAMGHKTVIRKLCKFLPKSAELAQALALEALTDAGQSQRMNVDEVSKGTYLPPLVEPEVKKIAYQQPEQAAALSEDAAAILIQVEKATAMENIVALGSEVAALSGTDKAVVMAAIQTKREEFLS